MRGVLVPPRAWRVHVTPLGMFKLVVSLSDRTGCCLTKTWQSRSRPTDEVCVVWRLISEGALSSPPCPLSFYFPLLSCFYFPPLLFHSTLFSPLCLFRPSLLWCVCQQHSCLEQSTRADICRTVSLIWSVAWSIGVMKSNSRRSASPDTVGDKTRARFSAFFGLLVSQILGLSHWKSHFSQGIKLFVVCAEHLSFGLYKSQTVLAVYHIFLIEPCLQTCRCREQREVSVSSDCLSAAVMCSWCECSILTVKLDLGAWGNTINDKTNDRINKRALIVAVQFC